MALLIWIRMNHMIYHGMILSISFDDVVPIVASIACNIWFNCFVEKPGESVDLMRFQLGISAIISIVRPKIGPRPIVPLLGYRDGNA